MKKVIMIASVMFSIVVTSCMFTSCTLNINTHPKKLTYEEKLDSIRESYEYQLWSNQIVKLSNRSKEIDNLLKIEGADSKALNNEQNTIVSAIHGIELIQDKCLYNNEQYQNDLKGVKK